MMPDPHYVDTVAEADRDEIRRLETQLKFLQSVNQRLRDEIAKFRDSLSDANNRLSRLRAGGSG